MFNLLKYVLKNTIETKLTSKLLNIDNNNVNKSITSTTNTIKQTNKRKLEEMDIEEDNDSSYSFKKARYPLRNLLKKEETKNTSNIDVNNSGVAISNGNIAIQQAPIINQSYNDCGDGDDGSSVSSSSSEEQSIDDKYQDLFKNTNKKTSFVTKKGVSYNQLNNTWNELNKKYYGNTWVSASKTRNYLINDPILDYFEMYCRDKKPSNDKVKQKFSNELEKRKLLEDRPCSSILELGHEFEHQIIDIIQKKFKNEFTQIVGQDNKEYQDKKLVVKTFEAMKKGIPIIYQAMLANENTKLFGIVDLLVRSDYLDKLIPYSYYCDNKKKAPKLNDKYHYVIVDIKWSQITFCANRRTIRNSGSVMAYKGQLTVYNSILGQIQGYTPSQAFIIGKNYKYHNQDNTSEYNNKQNEVLALTDIGVIDYKTFDYSVINKTIKAIEWYRDLAVYGKNWDLKNPIRYELRPNMSNTKDYPWHELKEQIAEENKELTSIWMVGTKNREHAFKQHIFKWDDPKCNSDSLGITGKKRKNIVDSILKHNKVDNPNKNKIIPEKIKNNMEDWQVENGLDFYIDFETLSTQMINSGQNLVKGKPIHNLLFMIGVYYKENNAYKYKNFTINKISLEEERRIMDEFINFIEGIQLTYIKENGIINMSNARKRFFYWSNAEEVILEAVNKRNRNFFNNFLNNSTFIDMLRVFHDEPIIIPEHRKFGLKEIGKKMYKYNFINTTWVSEGPENGLDAMLKACNFFKDKDKNSETMEQIIKYNNNDCKVLLEIVEYLRKHHT